jgi:hypothetical protein
MYSDVYAKLAEYLGLGSSPTGTDLTKVQDLTLRGYRRFLMPIDMSSGKVHIWKFLERTTTMSLQANEDTYKLPLGFSTFVSPNCPFTYTTPLSLNPVQKPVSYIYEQKSKSTGTGYPLYFCLKTGDYDTINGQQYEVVFFPTPNSTLNYYYTYIFTPPAPVNAKDVFIGDDIYSEAILESCLAVAEFNKYDSPNTPNPKIHAEEAERLIQALIGKDKQSRLIPNMGQITDGVLDRYTRSAIIYDSDGNQILPET